jgi:hypothetical protein
MTISKQYSNRSGLFLKLEFNNEEEYQTVIDTLKLATQCLKDDGCTEDYTKHEDKVIDNIINCKQVDEDGKITSVVWQENMLSLFCALLDMSRLTVDLSEVNDAMEELNKINDQISASYNKLVEEGKKESTLLREQISMHKSIIYAMCNQGLVLSKEDQKFWCGDTLPKDEDDLE